MWLCKDNRIKGCSFWSFEMTSSELSLELESCDAGITALDTQPRENNSPQNEYCHGMCDSCADQTLNTDTSVCETCKQASQSIPYRTPCDSQSTIEKALCERQSTPDKTPCDTQSTIEKALCESQSTPDKTPCGSQSTIEKALCESQSTPDKTPCDSQSTIEKTMCESTLDKTPCDGQSTPKRSEANKTPRSRSNPVDMPHASQSAPDKTSIGSQSTPADIAYGSQNTPDKTSCDSRSTFDKTLVNSQNGEDATKLRTEALQCRAPATPSPKIPYEQVIQNEQILLIAHLKDPIQLASRLYSKYGITHNDYDAIMSATTKAAKSSILIDSVLKRRKELHSILKLMDVFEEEQPELALFLKQKANPDQSSENRLSVEAKISPAINPQCCVSLRKCIDELLWCRNVDKITERLFSKSVINQDELKYTEKLDANRDRMWFLIKDIMRGTMNDFNIFVDSLRDFDPDRAKLLESVLENITEDDVVESKVVQKLDREEVRKDLSAHTGLSISRVTQGCIKLFVHLNFWNDLKDIQRNIDSNEINNSIVKWMVKRKIVTPSNIWLHVCLRIEFNIPQDAERLTSALQYAYCADKDTWYWSVDNHHWCHASRLHWPVGEEEGRIPKDDDLSTLQKLLNGYKAKRHRDSCIVCAMRELTKGQAVFDETVDSILAALVIHVYTEQHSQITENACISSSLNCNPTDNDFIDGTSTDVVPNEDDSGDLRYQSATWETCSKTIDDLSCRSFGVAVNCGKVTDVISFIRKSDCDVNQMCDVYPVRAVNRSCNVNEIGDVNESYAFKAKGALIEICKDSCDVDQSRKDSQIRFTFPELASKSTALMIAISRMTDNSDNFSQIFRVLMEHPNIDVNCQNSLGNTGLHIACQLGIAIATDLLLRDPRCNIMVENYEGNTPLMDLLTIKRTEKTEKVLECFRNDVHRMQQILENVNKQNKQKNSVLHLACLNGYFTFVENIILDLRCNVILQNKNGNLPCMVLLENSMQEHHRAELIAKTMLPRIQAEINTQNICGDTLLHLACKYKFLDVVESLLNISSCDVNLLNEDGNTAFMCLMDGHEKNPVKRIEILAIRMLKMLRGDINFKNKQGNAPLHIACKEGLTEVVQSLLSLQSCDSFLPNSQGKSFTYLLVERAVKVSPINFLAALRFIDAIPKQFVLASSKLMFHLPGVLVLFLREANDLHCIKINRVTKMQIDILLEEMELMEYCSKTIATAITHNSFDVCSKLLMKTTELVDDGYIDSQTALHCALQTMSFRKTALLMAHRPNLSIKWRSLTPLELAIAMECSVDILELLSKEVSQNELKQSIAKCSAVGESMLECAIRLGAKKWVYQLTGKDIDEPFGEMRGAQNKSPFDDPMVYSKTLRLAQLGTIANDSKVLAMVENCRSYFKKEEISEIRLTIMDFLRTLSSEIEQEPSSSHLSFNPVLVGSMAENTRTYYPDEFDVICAFKNASDIIFQHAFEKRCQLIVDGDSPWRQLCVGNCLEQGKVATALFEKIDSSLQRIRSKAWQLESICLFKYPLLLKDKISRLKLLWRGRVFKDLVVKVDLVPAFSFSTVDNVVTFDTPVKIDITTSMYLPKQIDLVPGAVLQSNHSPSLGFSASGEFYVIAKKSRHEYDMSDCYFHLSTSAVEAAVILSLPKNIKQGYVLAKAMRIASICQPKESLSHFEIEEDIQIEDFITSYLLKTCLFYLLQERKSDNEEKSAFFWAQEIYETLYKKLEQVNCTTLIDGKNRASREWIETGWVQRAFLTKRKVILALVKNIVFWMKNNRDSLEHLTFC